MTDAELIERLRELGDHASFEPHMHHTAADRIEALIAERDEAMQLLQTLSNVNGDLSRDIYKTKLLLAKAVEALEGLIQQTYDCEKELTEDLHHMDFCGESEPLTKARAALARVKGEAE